MPDATIGPPPSPSPSPSPSHLTIFSTSTISNSTKCFHCERWCSNGATDHQTLSATSLNSPLPDSKLYYWLRQELFLAMISHYRSGSSRSNQPLEIFTQPQSHKVTKIATKRYYMINAHTNNVRQLESAWPFGHILYSTFILLGSFCSPSFKKCLGLFRPYIWCQIPFCFLITLS